HRLLLVGIQPAVAVGVELLEHLIGGQVGHLILHVAARIVPAHHLRVVLLAAQVAVAGRLLLDGVGLVDLLLRLGGLGLGDRRGVVGLGLGGFGIALGLGLSGLFGLRLRGGLLLVVVIFVGLLVRLLGGLLVGLLVGGFDERTCHDDGGEGDCGKCQTND